MLDNWTEEQFFNEILGSYDFEEFANCEGRIAITDNPHLEKTWDQFVQALIELNYLYRKWQGE